MVGRSWPSPARVSFGFALLQCIDDARIGDDALAVRGSSFIGLRSGMRAFSAAILLLLQVRPLWGLVLCLGLGASDEGRMEAGCSMTSDADASAPTAEPSPADLADLTAAPMGVADPTNTSQHDRHGCMLADICTLVTPTLALRPSLLLVPDTPRSSAVWPSYTIHTQERRAPPTPPPNA